MSLRILGRALATPTLAVLVAACGGPSISDICDKSQGCIGGNDKDKAACVDAFTTDQELAEDEGCQSEFNDALTCVANASQCRSNPQGPCNTTADCAKQQGGVCSNGQCQVSAYGMDPKDTSCDAQVAAYKRCFK